MRLVLSSLESVGVLLVILFPTFCKAEELRAKIYRSRVFEKYMQICARVLRGMRH